MFSCTGILTWRLEGLNERNTLPLRRTTVFLKSDYLLMYNVAQLKASSELIYELISAAMKEKVILTEVALNVKRRNLQHASSLNYHRYNLKLKVIQQVLQTCWVVSHAYDQQRRVKNFLNDQIFTRQFLWQNCIEISQIFTNL